MPTRLILKLNRGIGGEANTWRLEIATKVVVPWERGGRWEFPGIRIADFDKIIVFEHFRNFFGLLVNSCYVGPFRNVLNLSGNTQYYDLKVGKAVIEDWEQNKSGHSERGWELVKEATDTLREIFAFQSLDISANYDRSDFLITVDGKKYPLSSIGAGFSQFLLVFANLLARKPSLILIDEPELSLHPALQARFVATLRSFATEGVLFATHNVGLARAVAEQIYVVRRGSGGRGEVSPWERTGRLSELIGEMGFTAYQDLGFEKLLLVEGPTEVKTIQQVLRLLNKDHEIVVFPLGGSGMITGSRDGELEEIKRITPKVFALIDSERTSENQHLAKDRKQFLESCERASIRCHATALRATENYFTNQAVRRAKRSEKYQALKPFEKLEDAPDPKWGKTENWMIAREMTAEEWIRNDLGAFLASI
jgi:energy-coupling factor transporter ATP-binding protein EcfA2